METLQNGCVIGKRFFDGIIALGDVVPAIPYRSKRKQAFSHTDADLSEESRPARSFKRFFGGMFHDDHLAAVMTGCKSFSVFWMRPRR